MLILRVKFSQKALFRVLLRNKSRTRFRLNDVAVGLELKEECLVLCFVVIENVDD